MEHRKIKIKIHNAEDDAGHSNWVKIALCPDPRHQLMDDERKAFAERHFEFVRFEWVGKALKYYDDTEDYPDVLITDIDFRNLSNDRLDETAIEDRPNLGIEKTSTRGIDLLSYAFSKFPERVIRYLTGQINEEEVAKALSKLDLSAQIQVIKTDKTGGSGLLESQFPSILKQVAHQFVRRHVSLAERERLRRLIKETSKTLALMETVHTTRGDFSFEDFVVGWSEITDEELLRKEMLDLFTLNLTLSASESFGIAALKQVTHPRDMKYYIPDDWFEYMTHQLEEIKKAVQQTIEVLPNLPYLSVYKEQINAFESKAREIGPDFEKAKDSLTDLRRQNFRFGTSRNSLPIEIGSWALSEDSQIEARYPVEFYLPIHRLYQDEFDKLKAKCDVVKCHSVKTKRRDEQPVTWASEEMQPALFEEYLIFGQKDDRPYPDHIPLEQLPDYFAVFREKGFCRFGKQYLLLWRGTEWKLYDCTYAPVIERSLDRIQTVSEGRDRTSLWDFIQAGEGIVAYFLFKFIGWRQP